MGAAALFRLHHLTGHLFRLGAGAHGVGENVHIRKAALGDEFQRCLLVIQILTGEARNEVGGKCAAGEILPQIFHTLVEASGIVLAVHVLQCLVAAALERQMEVGTYLPRGGNAAGKIIGNDRRLQRTQAQTHIGCRFRNGLDTVGQSDVLPQILAIGGDFNARDHQLTVAFRFQLGSLLLYLGNGQGAHTTAGIGNDAVGAEVHAAVLDLQHGAGTSADSTCGQFFEVHTAEGVVDAAGGLLFQYRSFDGIDESMLIPCAEYHVAADVRRVVGAQLAPAAADNSGRLGMAGRQVADSLAALSAAFRCDRTGIDDDGIGLLTFCGSAMAPLSQHGFDGLCFVLIDLTAKS